jgi:hypothetical protein
MIVAKVRGGLGNQLFIYAAGRCLSIIHNVPLLLDASWYLSGSRRFWLDQFNIGADITWDDLSGADDGIGFNQEHWSYYSGFMDYSGYKFISGWWQSERFFEPVKNTIRNELKFLDSSIQTEASKWIREFRRGSSGQCIAMHRRRQDYVNLAAQGKFNLLCDNYYLKAMARFPPQDTFLLFSDDIQWCRDHMNIPGVVFCDIEDTLMSFAIMSLCDHYIIANSTFSWWAAWVGESPNKMVVAPNVNDWFGPELLEKYEVYDIIPKRWIQLVCNN